MIYSGHPCLYKPASNHTEGKQHLFNKNNNLHIYRYRPQTPISRKQCLCQPDRLKTGSAGKVLTPPAAAS